MRKCRTSWTHRRCDMTTRNRTHRRCVRCGTPRACTWGTTRRHDTTAHRRCATHDCFPHPFLRISDAHIPRGRPPIPHALRGAQHPPHLRCDMPTRDGRIGDAIYPHEMDASEMRKVGNPTCIHVGGTKQHDTTARRRCAGMRCGRGIKNLPCRSLLSGSYRTKAKRHDL